jgi:hypothetical protein
MKRKSILAFIIIATLPLASLACVVASSTTPPTEIPGLLETVVHQTAYVAKTVNAFNTLVVKLTEIALATPTPLRSTSTPLPPTTTQAPLTQTAFTQTTLPATSTSILPTTLPSSTLTGTQIPCLRAEFIDDISIPDGTTFLSGQSFTKTWRMKNTGSCAWTSDFTVTFISGNGMGASASQPLNANVLPGQMVDVSVAMIAPNNQGEYTGYWMLRSPFNMTFGIGSTGNKPFYVKIQVQQYQSNADPNVTLDFAASFCNASWRNSISSLPCPGTTDDFTQGSVNRTNNPTLEGGYVDDEPALILIPNDGSGGSITGRYPAFKIQGNEHFTALIGCLNASPNCNVLFQLNYIADGGSVQSLGGWQETSDGKWTHIDLSLSDLAGKNVEFILSGLNNNGSSVDDRLFVLSPVIKR